jgi:hypothetical protein
MTAAAAMFVQRETGSAAPYALAQVGVDSRKERIGRALRGQPSLQALEQRGTFRVAHGGELPLDRRR